MLQSLDPFEREAKGQENTFSVKRKSSLSIVKNILLKYTMYIKSILCSEPPFSNFFLHLYTLLTMLDLEPITGRYSNQQKKAMQT